MRADTMWAMRKAAALAFAVPGLEVDISSGHDLVARIQRQFGRTLAPVTTTLLPPCAFRSAVGRLLHDGTSERALFLGLQPDAPLRIDYFMPFTGAARPLGRLTSRVGETVVHVFATTRPLREAAAVIASTGRHPSSPVALACARDEVAQVTLVYCESPICDVPVTRPHIEALIDAAFVRLGAEEIAADIAALTRSADPL